MAPSTPPPPMREEFAAFTIAPISRLVMSPRHKETLLLRVESGAKREGPLSVTAIMERNIIAQAFVYFIYMIFVHFNQNVITDNDESNH